VCDFDDQSMYFNTVETKRWWPFLTFGLSRKIAKSGLGSGVPNSSVTMSCDESDTSVLIGGVTLPANGCPFTNIFQPAG
jgi:hypothetical protein